MPSSARSLAEHLRLLSDDRLTAVLTLRPDLLRPVPKSLADLALRVNSAASVILALDDLTREQLQVLEAACALAPAGRFGVADLAGHLDGDPDRVRQAVIDLTTRVLLWGTDDDVRVPSEVRTAMGPHPAGLDPVVRENLIGVRLALADPDAFADRLALAPADARELLQRHAWGPPEIPEAPGRDWLARQDFMAVDDAGTVIIPREIALVLRRGALSPDPLETPPAPRTADETLVAAADRHAGHAADLFVRDAERVLRQLQHRPLRRQGNGILRDWDTFVPTTGVAADQAALVLALAWDRGLVDLDDDSLLRTTSALDRSLTHSIARRWGEWVAAWLALERPAHDSRHVTGTGRDPQVPAARRMVLAALADGAGTEVLGWTAWYRPRSRIPGALLAACAADAETLGLAFGGILSSAGLAAAAGVTAADTLGDTVAPSLPALTDRIILQADLTATALGPLDAAVERRLSEVADWESGGAAAVFRFTPDSVRAALARGADGAETLQRAAWRLRHGTPPGADRAVLRRCRRVAHGTGSRRARGDHVRAGRGRAPAHRSGPRSPGAPGDRPGNLDQPGVRRRGRSRADGRRARGSTSSALAADAHPAPTGAPRDPSGRPGAGRAVASAHRVGVDPGRAPTDTPGPGGAGAGAVRTRHRGERAPSVVADVRRRRRPTAHPPAGATPPGGRRCLRVRSHGR
ncbi:MAG: helicase-associated domain-containing protein [Candidatus Nanopelagicales bacterium]